MTIPTIRANKKRAKEANREGEGEGESYVDDYIANPKVYGDVEHEGWTTEEEEDYELLRLELALVFPEEEGMMQQSSVSISLSF